MRPEVPLYLLPGFHGSAVLFDRLIAALPSWIDTQVIAFRNHSSLEAHVDAISSELPNDEYYLLAESFSGPIALELMARHPNSVRGAILSASFARSPHRLLVTCGAHLPRYFFGRSRWKKSILNAFCLNGLDDEQLRREVLAIISDVEPEVVRGRLEVLARTNVRKRLKAVSTPILCLKASDDRVVKHALTDELAAQLPRARLETIDGPHLLLQTRAELAAPRIVAFIEQIEGENSLPAN